jgi:hypothetical protein
MIVENVEELEQHDDFFPGMKILIFDTVPFKF